MSQTTDNLGAGTGRHASEGRSFAQVVHVERCGERYILARCAPLPGFTWASGQHLDVILRDAEGDFVRPYSIASAATDGHLDFCVALGGDGRAAAVWRALKPGVALGIGAANGNFRVSPGAKQVTLIAGGSGVAPIRALLREALADGSSDRQFQLIYGCADASAAPYAAEFVAWTKAHASSFAATLVAERGDAPGFGRGTVLGAVLTAVAPAGVYGICGPRPMVDAVVGVLGSHGVASSRVFSEAF